MSKENETDYLTDDLSEMVRAQRKWQEDLTQEEKEEVINWAREATGLNKK